LVVFSGLFSPDVFFFFLKCSDVLLH